MSPLLTVKSQLTVLLSGKKLLIGSGPCSVLRQTPPTSAKPSKGKNGEIERWEAELRSSLAKKKAGTGTLSKAEQELVNAQLAKEAQIRAEVGKAIKRMQRGLAIIRSLVDSSTEEVRVRLPTIISTFLSVATLPASSLVNTEALQTYEVSSQCILLLF
jgi:hypothetical protein